MSKDIYSLLKEDKAVAVIRTNTYEEAKEISLAAIKGGIKVIEVTMSVPNGAELINELKQINNKILVGAGTVLTKEQLIECVDKNADFIK